MANSYKQINAQKKDFGNKRAMATSMSYCGGINNENWNKSGLSGTAVPKLFDDDKTGVILSNRDLNLVSKSRLGLQSFCKNNAAGNNSLSTGKISNTSRNKSMSYFCGDLKKNKSNVKNIDYEKIYKDDDIVPALKPEENDLKHRRLCNLGGKSF